MPKYIVNMNCIYPLRYEGTRKQALFITTKILLHKNATIIIVDANLRTY